MFAFPLGAILKNVDRQRCGLGNVLGREVAATLGIERLADILIGGLELPVDAEQGHQVLRTASFEFANIGFVVTNVSE